MSDRLFGTDGVRGVANEALTPKLAFDLGRAAVRFLGRSIVIGRDTRRSGGMLEAALSAGIMSCGGDVFLAGIIPTPAVALITASGDYDGGIVISASHNPPDYNGIKFFSGTGFKLPDELEDRMQAYIESGCPADELVTGQGIGMAHPIPDAEEIYISNAVSALHDQGIDLTGMKIFVDCGYGASYRTTPEALRRLGATVVAINTEPDGDKINVGCGSTDLSQLREAVALFGADLGLAHDGDADRLQAVDENGDEIDGDQIEAICAIDMRDRGVLKNNTVVTTVMCNLGFRKAMEREGIAVETTSVGDRYVLERMRDGGFVLGGEQSGHMIFLEQNTTGDGLVTALNLLAALRRSGKNLSELVKVMERFPQALVNVPVNDKGILERSSVVADSIEDAQGRLGSDGSILVRPSGTEQLIRVMVEASDMETANSIASEVARVISVEDAAAI